MARLKLLILGGGTLALLASCSSPKPEPAPLAVPAPVVTTPTDQVFPTPYFPVREVQLIGKPVGELSPGWTTAGLYTEASLDDRQKAFVAGLDPAGGEGQVGLGFSQDFDGDGKTEAVAYGAWARGSQEEGNFVLVTREGATGPEVLLLRELPGPPRFTVFTLKPDGSLWFGGGIDAGEVTLKLVWDQGRPVFSLLGPD